MADIPHEPGVDNSTKLLEEGYNFISNRCERYRTDVFSTRLMGRKAWCARGEDAARMFYTPGRFTRAGAMPPTTMRLLQDEGSVQPLDGEAHRHRKRLFMDMMTPAGIERLRDIAAREWMGAIERWQQEDELVLFDAVREVLTRIGCTWAGVPVNDEAVRERAHEFAAMLDAAGSIGPRSWRGLAVRHTTEKWARDVIRQIRDGTIQPADERAAALIAHHRDTDGEPLTEKAAAVELINVLRPIVAVGRFIAYAALALHRYPGACERVRAGGAPERRDFAQEVRRFYPFFPLIGGRVLEPFDWRGRQFEREDWVLLDLYGTDHDPGLWRDPEAFRPERFADGDGNDYDFIPQGGGDVYGHRCPGDVAAVTLIEVAIDMLAHRMRYSVPEQDLEVDPSDLPAAPKEGFRIRDIAAR
jgi:fatty-acid peroxygenase